MPDAKDSNHTLRNIILVVVGILVAISAFNDIAKDSRARIAEAKNKSAADALVPKIGYFVNAGMIDSAKALLESIDPVLRSEKYGLKIIIDDIRNFESADFLNSKLSELSAAGYKKLTSNTLDTTYLRSSRALNLRFLNKMYADRAKYKKLKKARDEWNELLAVEAEATIKELNRQTQLKKVENQFSSWDGSHYNLTQHIKQSMNNPKSYEHVETNYWLVDDHLVVKTTFRGSNAFGAIVRSRANAKIALDGTVLDISYE